MRCLAASGFLQRVEELGCGFGFWILDLGMKKGFPEVTGNPACGAKGTPLVYWHSAVSSAFRNCGYQLGYLTWLFLASFIEVLKGELNDYHHIFPWESPPPVADPSGLMLSLVMGEKPPPTESLAFFQSQVPPVDVPPLTEPPEEEPVFEYDGADWLTPPEYEPPTFEYA